MIGFRYVPLNYVEFNVLYEKNDKVVWKRMMIWQSIKHCTVNALSEIFMMTYVA